MLNQTVTHFASTTADLLGALPAPPSDSIGPFRLYGLMIALGVIAAVVIAQRRWSAWGGEEDTIVAVAVWAVPAGLIGARLYHVLTDWGTLYDDGRWTNAFKIWQGGLGIPGGVLAGAVVGIIVARRTVPSWRRLADAVAPAIPVAQAIGRLGNYFNQELYGGPTDLPWGLRVDDEILALQNPGYAAGTTFHPTFLYEGLWNLALAGLIIALGRRFVLKPGRWFAVYVMGYGLGRLWVENLRIDEATLLWGVRVNIWMSLVIILGGLIWLLWGGGPLDREATAALRAGTDPAEIFGAETSFHPTGAVAADSDSAARTPDGEPVEPEAPPAGSVGGRVSGEDPAEQDPRESDEGLGSGPDPV
ncbi:MAG: prolipoprotein diacylglyceryl transferase [Microthrixaceae bacterium]|nr:prolipoprotein diacylglyceryl transferase [Microthrixaceae bacterium]